VFVGVVDSVGVTVGVKLFVGVLVGVLVGVFDGVFVIVGVGVAVGDGHITHSEQFVKISVDCIKTEPVPPNVTF
jgi:hypothetical protein